jgi:hypothetical protein
MKPDEIRPIYQDNVVIGYILCITIPNTRR